MEKKDIRIMVIEDDPIQINWAKEQLKEYNLTIATTTQESKSLRGQAHFDLIITDLQLPLCSGEEPRYSVGIDHFTSIFAALRAGEIKGLSVVSNFEHHISSEKEKDLALKWLNDFRRKKPYPPFIHETADGFGIRVTESSRGLKNFVLFMDKPLAYPKFFLLDEKSVVTKSVARQKGEKLPPGERAFDGVIRIVQHQVAIPLKPYGEIAEYLAQFCE